MPKYLVELPPLKLLRLVPDDSRGAGKKGNILVDGKIIDAGTKEYSQEEFALFLYNALMKENFDGAFAKLDSQDVKVEKVTDIGSNLKAA